MHSILKRPMFRKGGLTQRRTYSAGTDDLELIDKIKIDPFVGDFSEDFTMKEIIENQKKNQKSNDSKGISTLRKPSMEQAMKESGILMDKYFKPQKDNRLTNFLARFGPALANETGGSLLQNIARSLGGPTEALIKETAARRGRDQAIEEAKLNRAVKIYDRDEERMYKQNQKKEFGDEQETADIKTFKYFADVLFPGKDLGTLSKEELDSIVRFRNGKIQEDETVRTEYFDKIYKEPSELKMPTEYWDTREVEQKEAYDKKVLEREVEKLNRIRSRDIHEKIVAAGRLEGDDALDINLVDIFDDDLAQNPAAIRNNVLYAINTLLSGSPAGAVYFYLDRNDETGETDTVYVDYGFNVIKSD